MKFLTRKFIRKFLYKKISDLWYSKFAVPMYVYISVVIRHPRAHCMHSNDLARMLKNSMLERDWYSTDL